MSHFNLALFPRDIALIKTITDLAEKNLSGQTDKYLLGKQALPHVTLAQFECEAGRAEEIWHKVEKLAPEPLSIRFAHMYVRPGSGALHQDKNWVGLSVVPDPALNALQNSVYERLGELGIESTTSPDTYFPHVSLGRLTRACAITIAKMPGKDFWQKAYAFDLSLGHSNAIGAYSERMF